MTTRAPSLAILAIAAGALALAAGTAGAQQQRGRQTIEIRGQVPTPQVVTVRPREVPQYSRQVLVPLFYDRTFWPSILPAYALVPVRQLTGALPVDTAPQPVAAVGVPALPLPTAVTGGAAGGQPGAAGTGGAAGAGAPSAADSAAQARAAAARQAELEAIRAELARRRARLDSLAREVDRMGRPRQRGEQNAPPDTTRQTPSSPDGGSPR
jgi:hypothetical protein